MEAALQKPVPVAVKQLLFGLTILLLCLSTLGYGYWKLHPSITLSTSSSPEQIYYKQMVYAVNEMHNQVERDTTLQQHGALSEAQIEKGKAYVRSLMSSLTSSPEELSVAQYITEALYRSYQQYLNDLEAGAPSLKNSLALTENNYSLFRQNADLIKVLSAYNGINIDCH